MKAKRVLAAVLCAAMIFSSESFSMGVMAAPDAENVELELVVETPSPEETSAPEESETPSAEPEESAAPEETPAQTPDESAVPENTPEVSSAPEETETPSATPEATQDPEATPSEMPEELETPTPEMTPSPEILPEDEMIIGREDMELVGASGCFEVDANGRLKIKEGQTITLSTVWIPAEAKIIPKDIFSGNGKVNIVKFDEGSQLTTIEAGAFEDSALTEIEIPEKVTEINDYTFKNSSLKSISFKGQVVSVGKEAFQNTNLTDFVAPASLETIKDSAFDNCSQLQRVTLTNVKVIGTRAFQHCRALRDGGIGWSSELVEIGNYAFAGCDFDTLSLYEVNKNGSHEISIGAGAFYQCSNLYKIVLPANLTEISNKMFMDCKKLTDITMPDTVEVIEVSAFSGCTSLKEINISSGIKRIKESAFERCSSLTTVTINQKNTIDDFEIAETAFPIKSGVTMKGYDGLVQEYAEKMGYTFESLNETFAISVTQGFSTYAGLTANKLKAAAGTEMTITVKPKSGYSLRAGSIRASGDSSVEFTLVSCTSTAQTFSFIMPARKVVIDAEFDETKAAVTGSLKYRLDKVNERPITVDYTTNEARIDKTGQETQLVVYDSKDIGAWLVNFKSSNTSVATISDTGLICAKGKGTTTISASLRSDAKKNISFKLTVGEDAFIEKIELNFTNLGRGREKKETVQLADGTEKTYTVIEYSKAALTTSGQSFKVNVTATEKDETRNLMVTSDWKSIDSSIAAPASAKSSNNSNTINVKKGMEGETMITVSVTNKDKDKTVREESFIIRVIDATPRLADSKITVNTLSETGTYIDIVTVYDREISEEVSLSLCQKTTSGNITDYNKEIEGLEIEYNKEKGCRIYATGGFQLASGKSVTYKSKTQVYIKGQFEEGGTFYIPVQELTVVNKALNPTVKVTGKINLFYNHTSDKSEQGSVQVTQNLKDVTVERYELVSEANYKDPGSETQDSFAANFNIDEKGEITRSDAQELTQVKGKNVVTGYVYIYYEGYNQPVKKKITVPTCNTAPSYVLSATSATASVFRSKQSYQLQLLDKKTKKPIDLSKLDAADGLSFDESASGTTPDLFEEIQNTEAINAAIANGYIELKVKDDPRKGKAVMNVQMSTWSKPLKYTFSLSTTNKLPTVKLSSSSVTLNRLCKSQGTSIKLTLNQKDAVLVGFDEESLTYTGNKKYIEDAESLMDELSFENDTININLPSDDIKLTTYSFKIRPLVSYEEDEEPVPLGYVSFKVVVNSKAPTIKLKSTTFSLNASKPGIEELKTTYTLGNLPAGSTWTIDATDMELIPVSKSQKAADIVRDEKIIASFDNDGTVRVKLKATKYYEAFNYEYYVNGLAVKVGDDTMPLGKFKIKVKGNLYNPGVTVTAKGTINPVEPDSSIVYTGKVTGISSDISSVKILELDMTNNKGLYYRDEDGNRTSKHFAVKQDGNKAVVTVKEGEVLKSGATYKIKLVYTLAAVPGTTYETKNDLTIKPKQTLPKIKATPASAYLYAGQNRPKTVDVALSKTSVKGADIVGVDFAKGTSEAVKKAYRIEFDQEKQVMTLKLVNPSALVLNKKQTITFETKCKDQMENSTGTTFKVDVTVKK